MSRFKIMGPLVFFSMGAASGCSENVGNLDRINMMRQESLDTRLSWDQAMVDSALLEDMCLTDIHFEPSSTEISMLGERRLERYAFLLRNRGGTLFLASANRDDDFNRARAEAVTSYLNDAGVEVGRIETEPGLAVGPGINAVEAIEVKERAFNPERQRLTDLLGGGTGGGFGAGN